MRRCCGGVGYVGVFLLGLLAGGVILLLAGDRVADLANKCMERMSACMEGREDMPCRRLMARVCGEPRTKVGFEEPT
jgi:hypothetical protein